MRNVAVKIFLAVAIACCCSDAFSVYVLFRWASWCLDWQYSSHNVTSSLSIMFSPLSLQS